MIIAIVPFGYAEMVLKIANKMGSTGGTVIHGRGAEMPGKEGLFSFHVEPREDIVLIMANKEITRDICHNINDEFKKNAQRGGSLYVLPVERMEETLYNFDGEES